MFSSGLKGVIYLFKVIIKFQHNPCFPRGKETLWTTYFSHPWSASRGERWCPRTHCHGNEQGVWGHWEAGAWKTVSWLSSFPFSATSSSFKATTWVKYDEAPDQLRKANSITAKSNSSSRMEAHEEQARVGGRADYSGFSLLSAESDVGAGGWRSGLSCGTQEEFGNTGLQWVMGQDNTISTRKTSAIWHLFISQCFKYFICIISLSIYMKHIPL